MKAYVHEGLCVLRPMCIKVYVHVRFSLCAYYTTVFCFLLDSFVCVPVTVVPTLTVLCLLDSVGMCFGAMFHRTCFAPDVICCLFFDAHGTYWKM